MPIRSFNGKLAAAVFEGKAPRRLPPDLTRRLLIKLRVIDQAEGLHYFASLPGLHFEALAGDREGQYSIRVNRQWRVCFRWRDGDAYDVEFVDYH